MFIHENEDGTTSVTGSVNQSVLDAYNQAKKDGSDLTGFAPYLAANSAEAQAAQGAQVSYPAGIEPSPEAVAADERAVQAAQAVQEGSDERSATLAGSFSASKSGTTADAAANPAGPDYPYADKSKADLQADLEARGLPTSGNKDELVDRLRENDQGA